MLSVFYVVCLAVLFIWRKMQDIGSHDTNPLFITNVMSSKQEES